MKAGKPQVGDRLTIEICMVGRYGNGPLFRLPITVTLVLGHNVHFRYDDNAEIYAGLRGLFRLGRGRVKGVAP